MRYGQVDACLISDQSTGIQIARFVFAACEVVGLLILVGVLGVEGSESGWGHEKGQSGESGYG